MKKSEAALIWAQEQVAMLQPLLNIQHWRLTVIYDGKREGVTAETEFRINHHQARIVLAPPFVAADRAKREHTILHELVHVQHEDAIELARQALDGSKKGDLIYRLLMMLEEKAVDDMAGVLHGLIYR